MEDGSFDPSGLATRPAPGSYVVDTYDPTAADGAPAAPRVFAWRHGGRTAALSGGWKLVGEELYFLPEDPGEERPIDLEPALGLRIPAGLPAARDRLLADR